MAAWKIEDHFCTLPCIDANDCLILHISSGYFVEFRRKFRKFFLVSQSNPESKAYLKSTVQIHEEEDRQLRYHYAMIHPFSEFRIWWETYMIVIYLFLLIFVIPLELCFLIHTPVFIIYWKVILDVMCYGDMIVNFFTGYVDSERQKIELRGFKVALHYLLGFFVIDLVSSFPISLYIYLTGTHSMHPWKGFLFLKLFRLRTLHSYITKYLRRRKVWSSSLKSLALSMYFIVGVFWFLGTTIYMQTVTMNKEILTQDTNVQEKLETLINKCTEIIECVMLVGPDAVTFYTDWPVKIMNIFYIVAGSAINMIILAQVLRIYKSRNTARNKHQKLLQEISQYMTYRQIPPDLKEKIIRYVEFKYQKRILKEAEIMSTLSESLREEIMLHNCRVMVARVEFFRDMPQVILMKVLSRLRPEVYLKNESIYQCGSIATAMYFIYIGGVTIYSNKGKELMTLAEGKHFGEISLLNNLPRMYTAVARSDCELLRLNRKDLLEVMKPYPKIRAHLSGAAHEKLQAMKSRGEN
ncbi:hypothetical protein MTP99_007198 [Tenebrio molitor]|nr:hypothetical protein MTP99_007198 [Tenebrio molitor]CAH1374540.1 unnamed protein product [Tenebrio molitor]